MKKLYDRTTTAGRVLKAMEAAADHRGRLALSSRKLGALAGVSHWTVRASIADLAARGRVEVVRRGGNACAGDPGVYRVLS